MLDLEPTDIIIGRIKSQANQYFPELRVAEPTVLLLTKEHREFSSLYRFQVKSPGETRYLFVKSFPRTAQSNAAEPHSSRARLAPAGKDKRHRTWLEYTALKAIDDHFSALNNPRLGAIRVLDFIDEPQTIVMQENTLPDLRQIFFKQRRLSNFLGRPVQCLDAFHNAGAWLREYSRIPKSENITTRHATRDEFLHTFAELLDYVKAESGKHAFFDWAGSKALAAGARLLPAALPLGLGHGDYAMRNILVQSDGGVIGFDTAAKWRIPVYEDIAYFLTRLETNRPQIFSLGLTIRSHVLRACQREFLSGYFDQDPIPDGPLGLYQVAVLLDSWSAQLERRKRGRKGLKGIYDKVYLAILGRHYQTVIQRLLKGLPAP